MEEIKLDTNLKNQNKQNVQTKPENQKTHNQNQNKPKLNPTKLPVGEQLIDLHVNRWTTFCPLVQARCYQEVISA